MDIEAELKSYARRIFSHATADARQMLTVFLNESKDEDVRDFIINRNIEFALNVEKFRRNASYDDNETSVLW